MKIIGKVEIKINFVFRFTSGLFLPVILEDVEEGILFNLVKLTWDLKDKEDNNLISLELKNIVE